jgi:hypothetical protein
MHQHRLGLVINSMTNRDGGQLVLASDLCQELVP